MSWAGLVHGPGDDGALRFAGQGEPGVHALPDGAVAAVAGEDKGDGGQQPALVELG